LLGEEEQAYKVVTEYLDSFPSIAEKESKLRSLAQVVASNQPARVGGIAGNERRIEFMQWAEGRLSKKDLARIKAVDETYRATANAIGLMKANNPLADLRLLRKAEIQDQRMRIEASPEQSRRFIEQRLRPQAPRRGGLSLKM
jgi:hypothetical protein